MKLNYKRTHEKAMPLAYAHNNDSGMDLYAVEEVTLKWLTPTTINTGIALELPEGVEGNVRPKSGLSSKKFISCITGTIDADYRGTIGVIAISYNKEDVVIKSGDKIGQLVLNNITYARELVEVDELDSTVRGSDGFGSTGYKKKGDVAIKSGDNKIRNIT